jgi:hypothetical protein
MDFFVGGWYMTAFEEYIISKDTSLYKGLRAGISCTDLHSSKTFYVSEDVTVAEMYAGEHLCEFKPTRNLRLFWLNYNNVSKLLSNDFGLTHDTKLKLAAVTGALITQQHQLAFIKSYRFPQGTSDAEKTYINTIKRVAERNRPNTAGSRMSITNINRNAFSSLCKEFLTLHGYDGYYAGKKKTAYGNYSQSAFMHSEIMLCDAADTILRSVEHTRGKATKLNLLGTPMCGADSAEKLIPYAFLKKLEMNPITYDMFGEAITFLTGGMAVKLFLSNINRPNLIRNKRIQNSQDFDITVAVSHRIPNETLLNNALKTIEDTMDAILFPFIEQINKLYRSFQAVLGKKTRGYSLNPRLQNSITDRHVYQVIQYFITIQSCNKTIEFVDVALCYIPNVSDDWIDKPLSNRAHIPLLKYKYMLRETASILIRSFISNNPLNTKRNPINGTESNKGLKNVTRLAALCQTYKNTPTICRELGPLGEMITKSKKRNAITFIHNQNIVQKIRNLKNL